MTVLLVVLAVGFAYSIGAHYTGACMGMPHALQAISASRALLVMAPLTLVGATFASHGVERTVGHDLLVGRGLSASGLVIVIAVAFGVTTVFTQLRVPTSTIQILVFCVVGAGLATGLAVHWSTILALAVIWIAVPPAAAVLGYLFTRGLDQVPTIRTEAGAPRGRPPDRDSARGGMRSTGGRRLAGALVLVGALASFAMGANDVANATGSLVATHTFSALLSGLIGGVGLAIGVLTWGRPLLDRVAFEIVTVDRPMATAAQLVQAVVVLAAVAFGFFTSMNQALVGAMTGAGIARGRQTVHAATLLGILRGWILGPGAGITLAYIAARLVGAAVGRGNLLA